MPRENIAFWLVMLGIIGAGYYWHKRPIITNDFREKLGVYQGSHLKVGPEDEPTTHVFVHPVYDEVPGDEDVAWAWGRHPAGRARRGR